jgi:CRP/FNR family transcriptional regulator, cyclic AMP receptor protein
MTHICTSTRIKEDPSRACRAIGWRLGRRRMIRSHTPEPQFTLAGIAIFSALPRNALEAVHRRCSWRRYEPGEPIVDYLDSSDDVFFVASGEASVTIYSVAGQVVSFRNLGAGEIFGEYAAIDGEPRSASVEARTSCLIASMTAKEFRKLLETEPAVAQAVLKGLVRNIRSLTKRVYEFSTLAVNNRIQAELLRLASLAPREGKGARLHPAPTHAELASRVSTHREAVTRELNRLSRIGLIERESGTLIVRDLDGLAAMLYEMTGE